jgi:hypothetical protein
MSQPDLRMRARDIRAGLPGQLRRERLATASLLYGPLRSLDEVHRRLARTLPWRAGYVRRLSVVPLESADTLVPDEVLVKYDDAQQLGIFARFLVATPAYYWRACGNPWLIAEVSGTERWAILAGWDREAPGYTQPRGVNSAAGRY